MTGQEWDDEVTADLCGLPQPDVAGSAQARDQRELLASEFAECLRRGEAVSVEEYMVRYPALAAELRELLPLVAAMEDWKSHQRLRPGPGMFPDAFAIDRLGECRILREIGRGGMGIVYEAVQESVSRRVAVKLLPARLARDPQWRARFQREARIASQLRHANIVPVYSFGEYGKFCYYVMPFISGVGLDWIIDRLRASAGVVCAEEVLSAHPPTGDRTAEPLDLSALAETPEEAMTEHSPVTPQRRLRRNSWRGFAKIGAQVAAALRYAHGKRLLHGDIKPANVLLDSRGVVRITDFGLAQSVKDGDEAPLSEGSDEQAGTIAGTLRYMAPEQLAGRSDERSDIYALGVTLYELLTLRPAFAGETRAELRRAIAEGIATPPSQVHPDVPRALEAIVLMAADTDPARRYSSAEQFLADLLSFLHGGVVQALSSGFRSGLRRGSTRQR